jgi:hypothetical protein
MPGIDLFLSRELSYLIKTNLDANVLKQLEHSLFLEEGMSIKLSIEHFKIFHEHLKKSASFNIQEFEQDRIQEIFNTVKFEKNLQVGLINPHLIEKFLNYYGDPETRKILLTIMGTSLTVPQILEKSNVLKSPAYRKIENLLLDGFIVESGKIMKQTKRIATYECIFDEFQINVMKGKISIDIIFNREYFDASSVSQCGLFDK